ncbi:MAG: SprT family zinc-dependent metalloprotease [Prolixibacteraceae bacterium]|jgi:predicted metal-dependent hydrolase|nr:SprT family zinc-dependent metalloprotease [Prolixibacteraceae bacterium]
MPAQVIHINPVGDILFSKNNRSTRIRITVKPGGVSVTLPSGVPYREAIRFVESKAAWIVQQQSKMESGLPVFSPDTEFTTKFHRLKISRGNFPKVYNRIGNGIVQFFIPERFDAGHPAIQEYIRKTLVEVMRYEAKVYLPKRLDELSTKFGMRYRQVFVKNAKTRWGSCSSENNINLNLHLMRLPGHLIDYVILHELAHTVEKNHSPRFWKLLGQMADNPQKLRKEMRQYRVLGW